MIVAQDETGTLYLTTDNGIRVRRPGLPDTDATEGYSFPDISPALQERLARLLARQDYVDRCQQADPEIPFDDDEETEEAGPRLEEGESA